MEVDGTIIYFNEAKAIASLSNDSSNDEDIFEKPRAKKSKGKRIIEIKNLPVVPVDHKMTEEELGND